MLALVTTWLVIFGLLIYVGIPLWIDDDDPPFANIAAGGTKRTSACVMTAGGKSELETDGTHFGDRNFQKD